MQKKISLTLLVIIFSSMLIFAANRGLLNSGTQKIYDVTAPFGLFFSNNANGVSRFFSGIFSLGRLQKENGGLKDQVNRLQAEVAQLSEAKKENESLKKDLGFKAKHNYEYEAVEIIAFDPAVLRGTVVVNKGKQDGLAVGMAAISEGFLAGRIIEVSDKTAKVQLISDPLSAIPATLQASTTSGLVKGQIGFGLSLEKIPGSDPIKEGDIVTTSGLGGEIPKGLIIGKVESVENKSNSLFATANVRPSADLSNLYRLIIIKGL